MPRDDVGTVRCSAIDAFANAAGATRIGAIVGGRDDELFAARWRFERARIATANLSEGVLICRTVGTASVSRTSCGTTIRRRPAIGSISYVSPDTPAVWSVDGRCEACHVYLRPERLRRFAAQHVGGGSAPMIKDLFAVEDPWLKGYFQMLQSEFELRGEGAAADELFVSQAEQLLVQHLVQRHAYGARRVETQSKRRAHPLSSATLRRIEDYIEANLADEIALGDLAAVACMSIGHFLRAFRASSGVTPYQYVLKCRLHRACDMLRSSCIPVARVAQACGFKTASHLSSKFHASLGTSPSLYRAGSERPARVH